MENSLRSHRSITNELVPSTPNYSNDRTKERILITKSSSQTPENPAQMGPKPYDDLFIEPPGDYDVVYGDYNSTMDDGTGRRPYLRLTSNLPNATRNVGGEIRLKCEAAGSPLPISFAWLKNHAPVEKNRRTKIRNRDYWSKLVITDLDVLDSAYYQCTATNSAGSVNTTSVLRVNNAPSSVKNKPTAKVNKQKSRISDEYDDRDYDHYFDEQQNMDRGRLPLEEEEFLHVPNNAAGAGYVPLSSGGISDRWLDGKSLRAGECILYQGDACRSFLSGRHIMITSENREDMYDIDRQLRAAMMFIQNMKEIPSECKRYSHAVACYHMFKVCDKSPLSSSSPSSTNKVISLCRKDCDSLKNNVCPKELAMAAQHELVGDGPKALIPRCETLSPEAERCIRVLEPVQPPPPMNTPIDKDDPNVHQPEHMVHWCYVDTGKFYGGAISVSQSNRKCQNWSQSTSSEFNIANYPNLKTSKNYCRNPGGHRPAPWCFTGPHGEEELCDVPKCPENMYPHLREKPIEIPSDRVFPPENNNNQFTDSVNDIWKSLSSQWQFTAMAGIGILAVLLLFLFICCACCCRKKRRKQSETMTSSGTKKTTFPSQSCNGSSVTNSAINPAYYRKVMNGNLPPGSHFTGSYEMNALLAQNGVPTNPPYMGSLQYLQQQTQYSPQTSTEPPVEPYHIPHIQPQQLKLDRIVGEGQFGVVYCAEWVGGFMNGASMQVAIKSLKPLSSKIERENFEEEIKAVASFEHPNVIRLLGVSYLDSQQVSAVFEYMVHGDLHEFLKVREPRGNDDEKERYRNFEDFLRIATQIAYGMEYLSSMNYVHRDLAARNCLVGDPHVIKIADFGLLRSCYESDYYMMSQRTKMPIRWMSKEAVNDQRFSQASDVWSFGVTLWEMYTFGKKPYEGFSNPEVINMINNRHLLECPSFCPSNIYGVMVECWHENPDRRPSFSELHSRFQKWSMSGPSQFIMPHQNRASSTHSAGSSGGHRGSRQSSSTQSASLMRSNGIPEFGVVPSPAPNSQQGTITKLTMLNNGSSIVHSTPIGSREPQQPFVNGNNRSPKGGGRAGEDGSPLMKRVVGGGRGTYMYSDEDESSEED